jgi:hypothetical protein
LYFKGIVKDPTAPGSFGTWLSYSASNHPAAVSFVIMDFFLFFGVAVLTMVQASQVKDALLMGFFFFNNHVSNGIVS